MHTRPPQSHGQRRPSSRPLDVAASLVLTVGLLGAAAPVAQAETTPSTAAAATPAAGSTASPTGTPSPAPLVNGGLTTSITATFGSAPDKILNIYSRVHYVLTATNITDAPLNVELTDSPGFGNTVLLAPGQSKVFYESVFLGGDSLRKGVWSDPIELKTWTTSYNETTTVTVVPDIPLPSAQVEKRVPWFWEPSALKPEPSPSAPSTSEPIPEPVPAPTVATQEMTVTVTGRFLTKPGELVKEGTRVEFSQDVKNTGAVDITNVLGHDKLAVGESFHLTTTEAVVTAQNIKDGFVTPDSESSNEILPGGTRVIVTAPKLPIPDKAPVSTEAPDLDVKVSGTFQVKEGEPVVAGTKVKWVAALTNTGDTALRDVKVADSEKIAELPVGKTGEVTFESTVSERDAVDHSVSVAAAATATTRDGYDYSKQTLGTLAIPATTPDPAGPDAQPSATPSSAAAARSVTEVATSSSRGEVGTSSAVGTTRSTAGHLASTGSDAAAMLPAAGVLALLGAVGVFLGRRRRSRTATE
ncbi:LPXTG cell wall anchor domain-containing protein [Rathayibacter sp. VKM Ac-2928]|uniref:LPXTG cell wall anchor domain-containing protein n=1 Tax=Rathayibacter sp. VKM Ac-2928 TaxID=2929479 RepID=UPI001FB1D292|nr:LPXTG cell wall anchor domain-containing protein [Rathayibacter sp. VKM Ac-2928]MCJ1682765.1 LPXTG cell wall anchor domain-containing protein [Rathayibacter sp. VKM Ac-2928]